METVVLKNKTTEAKPLVLITMHILNELVKEGKGIVVYELTELAKDRDHKMWGNTSESAKPLLDPTGQMHDSIRNIILNAIEGEELNLKIVSPIDDG